MPYAAQLSTLDFRKHAAAQSPFQDWPLLRAFSRLETFKLRHLDLEVDDFYTTLSDMTRLTELEIAYEKAAARPLMDSVLSLTQLSALLLDHVRGEDVTSEMIEAITGMVQLTRLALTPSMVGVSLSCLTKLVDLKIVGYGNLTMDLSDTLSSMRHLTSLHVYKSHSKFTLASSALQQLTELKILKLWAIDMESDLLQVLATLPCLKELSVIFSYFSDPGDRFFAQLVPFSNLTVLGVSHHWKMSKTRIESLGRCMPRIQKIQFFSHDWVFKTDYKRIVAQVENSVNWSDLADAFPCFRRARLVLIDYCLRPYREYFIFSEIDLFCKELQNDD